MEKLPEVEVAKRRLRTRAVNPGPGSFRLLALLARLGAAGVEPLAHASRLSVGTTCSHLHRLERAGLVWRVPLRDGGGGVVAISRLGAGRVRDDDEPAVFPKSQVPSTAEHARAVSWVAADFELREELHWYGPTELRAERKRWRILRADGKGHMPDLGAVVGRHLGAIEVELHSKAPDRVRDILRGYRWRIEEDRLAAVLYVTTKPAVARLVRRQGDEVFLGEHLRLMTLDQIVARVRKNSATASEEQRP